MAKDECKVEDMLMTLRERNEQYHDIKERVVWLAGTVYFGFSLLVLKALLVPEQKDTIESLKPFATNFLVLIFALTFIFIVRQIWERCKTVVKSGKFNTLIRHLGNSRYRSYRKMMDLTRYSETKFLKKVCQFFCMGWSGVLVLLVVVVLFVAQLFLLYR